MTNTPAVRHAFAVILGIALLLAPLATNDYTQYVLNLVLIYVVIGIGLNFLLGYAGQFAFAHAGNEHGVALEVSAGSVVAFSSRLLHATGVNQTPRMRRVYLALVTLSFAQLIVWVLINWSSVTLGSDGVDVHAPYFFGIRLHGDKMVFYVILPVTAVMYWLARRILESHIGRSFVAIRENEIVARCNGIDIARTKTVVFALSAFYAGIGGALYALALGFIVPDSFALSQLVLHFSIVVLGGMVSLYGAVIGAVLLTTLPEVLRNLQALQEIIYGLVLMLVILVMPLGVAGVLKKWRWLPREVLARNWRAFEKGRARR